LEGVKVILEEWVIVIITHASGSIIIANGASADRVGESIAVSGHRRVDIFSLVILWSILYHTHTSYVPYFQPSKKRTKPTDVQDVQGKMGFVGIKWSVYGPKNSKYDTAGKKTSSSFLSSKNILTHNWNYFLRL
jgi:hypothetical protein